MNMPRMPNEIKPGGCFVYTKGSEGLHNYMYGNLASSSGQDWINNPSHYKRGDSDIDCLMACKASMTKEQYLGLLKGSILQYLWRFDLKAGKQDLLKAEFYLKRLIEEYVNE